MTDSYSDSYSDYGSESDLDSAIGDRDDPGTVPLPAEVYQYIFENGRLYHQYHNKKQRYFLPNDINEQDRLDLGHHLYVLKSSNFVPILTLTNIISEAEKILGAKSYFCPIDRPQRILDIGTGTGTWANELADLYPWTEVVGIDLSPIQSQLRAPNVEFLVDDALDLVEDEGDQYCVIYIRFFDGSLEDWVGFFNIIHHLLRPDGYLVWIEAGIEVSHASHDDVKNIESWQTEVQDAAKKRKRPLNIGSRMQVTLEDSIFQNIKTEEFRILGHNIPSRMFEQ